MILCISPGNDPSPSYDSFDDGDGSVVEELTSGDDDNGGGGGMMEATELLFQSFYDDAMDFFCRLQTHQFNKGELNFANIHGG